MSARGHGMICLAVQAHNASGRGLEEMLRRSRCGHHHRAHAPADIDIGIIAQMASVVLVLIRMVGGIADQHDGTAGAVGLGGSHRHVEEAVLPIIEQVQHLPSVARASTWGRRYCRSSSCCCAHWPPTIVDPGQFHGKEPFFVPKGRRGGVGQDQRSDDRGRGLPPVAAKMKRRVAERIADARISLSGWRGQVRMRGFPRLLQDLVMQLRLRCPHGLLLRSAVASFVAIRPTRPSPVRSDHAVVIILILILSCSCSFSVLAAGEPAYVPYVHTLRSTREQQASKMSRRRCSFNAHAVAVLAALHLSPSPSLGFALGAFPAIMAVSPLPPHPRNTAAAHEYSSYVAAPGGQRRLMASRSTRSGNILTIRGGALGDDNGDSEGGALASDAGDADDEGEAVSVDADVVDGPWADAAASASKLMSADGGGDDASADVDISAAATVGNESQKSSYFLSSLLWLSLVLDSVLNKAKRAALLADSAGMVAESASLRAGEAQQALLAFDGRLNMATAVPTAALAGGYALAAGVSFLLSRSPPGTKADTGSGNDDEDGAIVAGNIRKRLSLGLVMFGILNLAAGTTGSPYLGIAGNVINGHNALIALNGWSKGVAKDRSYVSDLVNGAKNSFRVFIGGSDYYRSNAADRLKGAASAAYLLATFAAAARSVQTARGLLFQRRMTEATATILSIAHLARLVLASSVALSLKEATDTGRYRGLFVLGLGGLVSICSAGVALPMMFADAGMRKVTSDAGKLLAFAFFTGFLSLSKMLASDSERKVV